MKYNSTLIAQSREQDLKKLSSTYTQIVGFSNNFKFVNPELAKDAPIYHHPIFSDLFLAWVLIGDEAKAKEFTQYYFQEIIKLQQFSKEVQAFTRLIKTISPEQNKDLEQLLAGNKETGMFFKDKICSNSPYKLNQFLEIFREFFGRTIDFSKANSPSPSVQDLRDATVRGVASLAGCKEGDDGFNGLRELGGELAKGINGLTSKIPTEISFEVSTEGFKVSASKQNFLAKITLLHLSVAQAGISCLGLVSGRGAVLATIGSLLGVAYTYNTSNMSKNFTQNVKMPWPQGREISSKELIINAYKANIASSALGLCMFMLGGRTLPAVCSTAMLGVSIYKYGQVEGEVFGISFN